MEMKHEGNFLNRDLKFHWLGLKGCNPDQRFALLSVGGSGQEMEIGMILI